MLSYLLLISAYSVLKTQGNDSECLKDIQNIATKNTKEALLMIYYSGRDVNDLGQFHECNDLKNARYRLVMIKTTLTNLALGICGPKSCSSKFYEENFKSIVKTYNLDNVILADEVEVTDPEEYNSRPLDGNAIAALIVISLVFLAVGIGTFIEYMAQKNPESRLRGWKNLIVSFSVITNWNKLTAFPENYDHLQLFNGVRVLGMLTICFGHTYVYSFTSPIVNLNRIYGMLQGFWHHLVFTPLLVVDIFFLMSGFLLAYLSIAEMKKRKGKMNWLMFVVHRIIRIAPIYFFVYMIYLNLWSYMGSGPAWPLQIYDYKYACQEYWWSVLLFVSNFFPTDRQACMGWGWFIANDMQFYVFSPIVLVLHYKSKVLGYSSLLGLLITNFTINFVQAYENDYSPGVTYGLLNNNQFVHSYIKPYCRMGPYIAGMMFGFIYRGYVDSIAKKNEQKEDIEMGSVNQTLFVEKKNRSNFIENLEVTLSKWVYVKLFRIIGFITGVFLMIGVLYLPLNIERNGPDYWSLGTKSLFLGLEHIVFSVGLILFLYPLISGFGESILHFLTNKYFAVAAKISFSFYLVPPLFINYFNFNRHQSLYLQDGYLLYSYPGTVILTTITATILTLAIESPIMALEKKVFRR